MHPKNIALPTLVALTVGLAMPIQASASSSSSAIQSPISSRDAAKPSISPAVYYDLQSDTFKVSRSKALALGYSTVEIRRFEGNLAKLTPAESRQLAEAIGLNIQALKEQRAIPAIIWVIAGAIGGAAADEIIGQVTNWGIGTACRNLNGRWGAFDDFCRSNGHI